MGALLRHKHNLLAGEWLELAAHRAFVGHPRRLVAKGREGGREFPGHLLASLTYYLPQLEQRPSPALPTPHQPAFNPNVCLPKIATSPSEEFIYYSACLVEAGVKGGRVQNLISLSALWGIMEREEGRK